MSDTRNGSSVADLIVGILRQVLLEYAPQKATLASSTTDDGVIVIEQSPTSPQAARIVANVEPDGGLVTLVFGGGSVFEVPSRGRRFTGGPFEDEIRTLCVAVVQGHFEETIWVKREEVVRAVGRLEVGGRVVRSSWAELFPNIFFRGEKRVIHYEAY